MKTAHVDAIRTKQWFVATVLIDGFPFRFERTSAYPLCLPKDVKRWLDGAHVVAFEGTREAMEEEMPGIRFPPFQVTGPRPDGAARVPGEARWLTGRNAELLWRGPSVAAKRTFLEELGL